MLRNISLALATTLALGAAPAVAATTSTDVPAHVVTSPQQAPTAAPQADQTDASRYANREKATHADHFKGGNVVVIGVSGGAVLVLLLLLLILI